MLALVSHAKKTFTKPHMFIQTSRFLIINRTKLFPFMYNLSCFHIRKKKISFVETVLYLWLENLELSIVGFKFKRVNVICLEIFGGQNKCTYSFLADASIHCIHGEYVYTTTLFVYTFSEGIIGSSSVFGV